MSVCCAFLSFSSLCSFSSYIFHFDPIMLKYNVMNPVRVMDHLSAPRILYVLIFLFLSSFRWKMSPGAKRISTDVPPVFFFFSKKIFKRNVDEDKEEEEEKGKTLLLFFGLDLLCTRDNICLLPVSPGRGVKRQMAQRDQSGLFFFSNHPIPISFSVFPAPP